METVLEDFSKRSDEWLETERAQCLTDLKFAKKFNKNKADVAARFNLLTRELNRRSET